MIADGDSILPGEKASAPASANNKQHYLQIIPWRMTFPNANSQRKTCIKENAIRIGCLFLCLFLLGKQKKEGYCLRQVERVKDTITS